MAYEPPVKYHCYFQTTNGKKGGIDLNATNDYEAAKEFWAIAESGEYKHLQSFKIVTHHLLCWNQGDTVIDGGVN